MKYLQLLSKYRNAIMGIAIIWIYIFHIFPYDGIGKYDIFKLVADFGYVGVDIFFFVSGFGLYHGYNKYNTKKSFYKKRFFRVIPTYIIFILIYLGKDLSITNFISTFLDLGWYFPNSNLLRYNWYMSAIMLFYLLFPFYMISFRKSPLQTTIIAVTTALVLTFSLALLGSPNTAIVTTRIPVFTIGVYASFLLNEGSININTKKILLLAIFTFIAVILFIKLPFLEAYKGLLVWTFGFYWIPFIVIIPGILISFLLFLDYLDKKYTIIVSLFSFLGSISLEIYLIHVNYTIQGFVKCISQNQSLYFVIMLVLSIVGGYIVHQAMGKVSQFVKR